MQEQDHYQLKKAGQRGFTLAELMIAAGISLFVLMAAFGLLVTLLKSEAKNYSNIAMNMEASTFLNYLSRDVRAASEVLTASNELISLELPSSLGDGGTEYISYTLMQLNAADDYYILRELTDSSGEISQKEFFKLDGDNAPIGMIQMQADVKDETVVYSTAFYDSARETTDDADQVRFISWEFPLYYEASNMSFSRKVTSPLIMLRNSSS